MIRHLAVLLVSATAALANGTEVEVVDRPMDLVLDQIRAFPESLEGRPNLSLVSRKRDDGNLLVQLTETGFLDDSVDGARHSYVLTETEDGGWRVLEQNVEYRCARGADPMKWQAGPCP